MLDVGRSIGSLDLTSLIGSLVIWPIPLYECVHTVVFQLKWVKSIIGISRTKRWRLNELLDVDAWDFWSVLANIANPLRV